VLDMDSKNEFAAWSQKRRRSVPILRAAIGDIRQPFRNVSLRSLPFCHVGRCCLDLLDGQPWRASFEKDAFGKEHADDLYKILEELRCRAVCWADTLRKPCFDNIDFPGGKVHRYLIDALASPDSVESATVVGIDWGTALLKSLQADSELARSLFQWWQMMPLTIDGERNQTILRTFLPHVCLALRRVCYLAPNEAVSADVDVCLHRLEELRVAAKEVDQLIELAGRECTGSLSEFPTILRDLFHDALGSAFIALHCRSAAALGRSSAAFKLAAQAPRIVACIGSAKPEVIDTEGWEKAVKCKDRFPPYKLAEFGSKV
jgi:hypothetical protein